MSLIAGCAPAARPPEGAVAAARLPYLVLEQIGEQRRDGVPLVREVFAGAPRRAAVDRAFQRPFLRWVLTLAADAARRARVRCTDDAARCDARFLHPPYYVLREGGNEPRQGLALEQGGHVTVLPDTWYVEIDPDDPSVLAHETGHVMMFQLVASFPKRPDILPHTTGAITSDVLAFQEGFAIHFETLAGDSRDDADRYARLHRDAFGASQPTKLDDTLVPSRDVMTYAQSYRRYGCIKENCFAFLPRVREELVAGATPTPEDLLARWTDTTYDPARVRSLEQMVASEGVVAALFYRLATTELEAPSGAARTAPRFPDGARYSALFDAFARVGAKSSSGAAPMIELLIAVLEAEKHPEERLRIASVALEVLHYTPVIADAPRRYAQLLEAAHRMDVAAFKALQDAMVASMADAVRRIVEQPSRLAEALAPQLWVKNDAFMLRFAGLELDAQPFVFDANTAVIEALMTVPGVRYEEARAIVQARETRRGFRDLKELETIAGVRRETVEALRRMHP